MSFPRSLLCPCTFAYAKKFRFVAERPGGHPDLLCSGVPSWELEKFRILLYLPQTFLPKILSS